MATPWWEFWAVEMLMRIVVCAAAVAPRPNARPRPRARRRNDLDEGRGNGRVDGMAVPVNFGRDESGPIAWAMQTRWRKPRPGRDYGGAAWPRPPGLCREPGNPLEIGSSGVGMSRWNVAGACDSSTCYRPAALEWVVLAARRRADRGRGAARAETNGILERRPPSKGTPAGACGQCPLHAAPRHQPPR